MTEPNNETTTQFISRNLILALTDFRLYIVSDFDLDTYMYNVGEYLIEADPFNFDDFKEYLQEGAHQGDNDPIDYESALTETSAISTHTWETLLRPLIIPEGYDTDLIE